MGSQVPELIGGLTGRGSDSSGTVGAGRRLGIAVESLVRQTTMANSRVPMMMLVVAGAACVPMRVPVRRDYAGIVVDAGTGRPLPGAKVVVESWRVPTPPGYSHEREFAYSFQAETDSEGRWQVPGEKDWAIGILAADGFPFFTDTYCASAPGYEPLVENPWAGEPTAPAPKGGALSAARPKTTIALRPSASGERRSSRAAESSPCGIPKRPRR
jgi:hypothetical protein